LLTWGFYVIDRGLRTALLTGDAVMAALRASDMRPSLKNRHNPPEHLRSVVGDRAGCAGDQQTDGQQPGRDTEGAWYTDLVADESD
jgi:hypothetical protein